MASPDLGIHTLNDNGPPGDIGQFLLDVDPCASTRPNWIPAGATKPIYDPTKAALAHEAIVASMIAPDPDLYPGGAIRLVPAGRPGAGLEYACLVSWFQRPGERWQGAHRFPEQPAQQRLRARRVGPRAGGFLLDRQRARICRAPAAGSQLRPGLGGGGRGSPGRRSSSPGRRAASTIRRLTRTGSTPGSPTWLNPMLPGPAIGLPGRAVLPADGRSRTATRSPRLRPGTPGSTSTRQSGLVGMMSDTLRARGRELPSPRSTRHDLPGQEYRGTVFYATFVGRCCS